MSSACLPPHPTVAYLFLVRIVKLLDFVTVAGILAGVIAAPFMLIGWSNYLGRRKEERVFPLKSVLFFAVPVLVAMLAGGVSTLLAQSRVAEFLDSVSSHCSVAIDGRPVSNRDEVLDALRNISALPAHHSSPTRIRSCSDRQRELSA